MKLRLPTVGAACLLAAALGAHAAAPNLSSIMPRGTQRGTETEFTLGGERLQDCVEALLYNPGVTIKELKAAEDGKSVKVKAAIAPGDWPALCERMAANPPARWGPVVTA